MRNMSKENKMQLKKMRDKVAYCLKNAPATRNSDKSLTIAVWIKFYPHLLNDKKSVELVKLFELPSQDAISRVRRKIQEQGLYPPSLEVALKRGWEEQKWRNFALNN